jgi:hypothetical protein
MMAETESFINSPKSGPGSLAIKAQKSSLQRSSALNRPLKHCRGNAAACKLSSNSEPVNERRFPLADIRPEKLVLQLKFYRAGGFHVRLRQIKKARANIGGNA